jgi:WS/DGAT/MGAT family acyltransferase
LAIVGGALHKYLLAKDELPQQSMAAAVPINIRVAGTQGSGGNQVSQMTVPVCSHIADPLKRLQAVTKGSHEAKELMGAIGAKTITEFANFMPSTLTASAAKLASNLGFANHTSPTYNCTVTNLPGPQKELYFTGARMLKSIGSGPLTDGNGLFHAVTTYCGSLSIAFLSCPAMMPDPEFYAQCLRESFAELAEAAGVKTETVFEVAAKPVSAVKVKTKAKAKAKTKAKTKTTGAAKPAARKKAPRRG